MSQTLHPAKMNEAEKEAYHSTAEAKIQTFRYVKPQTDNVKDVTILMKSPGVTVAVQAVRDGGENNLHYHVNTDQVYYVLKGRMRFYGG